MFRGKFLCGFLMALRTECGRGTLQKSGEVAAVRFVTDRTTLVKRFVPMFLLKLAAIMALKTEIGKRSFQETGGHAFVRVMAGCAVAVLGRRVNELAIQADLGGFMTRLAKLRLGILQTERWYLTVRLVTGKALPLLRRCVQEAAAKITFLVAIEALTLLAESLATLNLSKKQVMRPGHE